MPIKLAFSTVACPDWNLDRVVSEAASMGYEGVELRTLGPGSAALASDPALSDPAKVAAAFEGSGVAPVCLSTSVSLHHRASTPVYQANLQLKNDIELAASIGAPFVRVFAEAVAPGENRQSVIQRVALAVQPAVEMASSRGVQILFENAGSFNHAKEWWWLLELVQHPMVGMCWNVANAAAAGQAPAVSVPNLHSRIRMAKVKDTVVGEGTGFVPLGDGTVEIESFIKRLLGVGFSGYVSVEWDRIWFPSLAPADTYLPDAHQRLRGWLDAIEELEEKGRKVAAKAAARNAPKPAAAQ